MAVGTGRGDGIDQIRTGKHVALYVLCLPLIFSRASALRPCVQRLA